MAQVWVAFAGQVTFLTFKTSRTISGPPEAGHFGDAGLSILVLFVAPAVALPVILLTGEKTAGVANLGKETGDEKRPHAWFSQKQVGFWQLRQLGDDEFVVSALLRLHEAEGIEGEGEAVMNGGAQGRRQWIGVGGHLVQGLR